MSVFKVNVKWGGQTFREVELETSESPLVFKAQLFALSGVEPDRQKVMIKGQCIKSDDADWSKVSKFIKDGVTLLMMGTKTAPQVLDEPMNPENNGSGKKKDEEEEEENMLTMPGGMQNLGNTCYLNATCQLLKVIPELRSALQKFREEMKGKLSTHSDDSHRLTLAFADLINNIDSSTNWPYVVNMVQVLHSVYPRFAEKAEHGKGFEQQDANECWTQLVDALKKSLKASENARFSSFIDEFMSMEFESETTCLESESEEVTKGKEVSFQYSCYIDKDVKYIHSGLKNRLTETITKHCVTLDRDASFKKSLKLSRLPQYLTIQMVRFQYKTGKQNGEGINAKILKDIKFPINLDTFDLCSSDLQEKLVPMRKKFKEYEDNLVMVSPSKSKNKKSNDDIKEFERSSFEDDIGSSNSGYYELIGVLTHKGRASNSGHYVSWVKFKKNDIWIECNDDDIKPIHVQDVLKLSGGGDWHTAYLLLYAARKLPKQSTTTESTLPVDKINSENETIKK